jgi:RNA polymerase sigma-70 factor (ECF subfamily)
MGKMKFCSTTLLLNRIAGTRERLYRVALALCGDKMLADDLVQETMTAALKNYQQLREDKSLFGWMCCILRNNWYHHLRKQKPQGPLDEQLPSEAHGPTEKFEETEVVDQIRQAVYSLPMDQRQVISLVDLGELSYCDVAETLEIPIGTVMSRLHRARKNLLAKLKRPPQSNEIIAQKKQPIHLVE